MTVTELSQSSEFQARLEALMWEIEGHGARPRLGLHRVPIDLIGEAVLRELEGQPLTDDHLREALTRINARN